MNKNSEKKALTQVMGPYADNGLPSERPDFLIKNSEKIHGVEITDFFHTKTDAKLHNLPAYTTGLLEETISVHKADSDLLILATVTLQSEDGKKSENIRAIVKQMPQPKNVAELLLETISSKEAKAESYLQNCDIVDLIIYDQQSMFGSAQQQHFFSALSLVNAAKIHASPFREIFILSRLAESGQPFFYPIRANMFLADTLLYDHALQNSEHPPATEAERISTLAKCLFRAGHAIRVGPKNDLSLNISGWQIVITGMNIDLRNWTNISQPQLDKNTLPLESLQTEDYLLSLKRVRDSIHCSSALTMPVYGT